MTALSPFLPGTNIQYAFAEAKVKELLEKANPVGDCLECHLKPNAKGYSPVGLGGRNGVKFRAHRLVYIVLCEAISAEIMVLHKCDNRRCIRPEHLKAGTAKDNTQDMMTKGRNKYILPNNQKVDPDDVWILKEQGLSGIEIAEKLGVSTSTISNYIGKNGVYNDKK